MGWNVGASSASCAGHESHVTVCALPLAGIRIDWGCGALGFVRLQRERVFVGRHPRLGRGRNAGLLRFR
eukprot:5467562-Pleurochrysis_carterae.AAC.1